jgi:hypothetical protein
MAPSRPLLLEQLEDRTAPASLAALGAYPPSDADLHPPPVQSFVAGVLGANAGADGRLLDVLDGQQFHFILSADGAGAPAGAGVRMTIADPAGRVVFDLAAGGGTTWDGDVFLDAGAYQVTFTMTGPGGAPGSVDFELSGWGLWGWGWLGPQLNDTTQEPLNPSAAASVPAPASFFFLPENATDLAAGAMTSRGPSFQLSRAGGVGQSDALVPVLLAPAAAQRQVLNGPQAGAAARRDIEAIPAEPVGTAAPAEGVPVAVSRVAGEEAPTASFAAEESPPDRPATPVDSEPTVAPLPGPVVAEVAGPAESPPVVGLARVDSARVLWALGLGTVVLTTLALPARWCAVLVPERLRVVARKRREMIPSA